MLRNVARNSTLTNWQFMVDMDMAPSRFARKSFVHLAKRKKLDPAESRVYVLPAVEVKEGQKMPETRTDVLKRWGDDVQPFHNWCEICYKKSQDYSRFEYILFAKNSGF